VAITTHKRKIMSLVSTCVQTNDGKVYKNPILSGEDPELVIKTLKRTNQELHQRALDIFKDLGLVATLRGSPSKSSRLFDYKQELSINFIEAISYFISIDAPIPADKITKHDGIYDGTSECTLYRWPEKIKEVAIQNEGQRYWPATKPKWLPKYTIKKEKKESPEAPQEKLSL